MEQGFCKGQTDNLPNISVGMIVSFFKDNQDFLSAEMKGVKLERSARESYGDKAVGYVQLKRDGAMCTVKARMTPEHKVRQKAYAVTLICDEIKEAVLSVQCHGCAANQGGCKHAVAFLFWIHRKCMQPSTTEVQCYWKKSSLSCVGTSIKFLKAKDMGKKKVKELPPKDGTVFSEFVSLLKQQNITDLQLFSCIEIPPLKRNLSLHHLVKDFATGSVNTPDDFIKYASGKVTDEMCNEAASATSTQASNPLWHELRYGRITASKIYAASRCSTIDGSLVESILGAKFRLTSAMERGIRLETGVIQELRKRHGMVISSCGFLLSPRCPVLGASPDGIAEDFVVEVKCPSSHKTMETYIKNGKPSEKYLAQIQMQMYFAKKKKGLFCVADPDFELNQAITELWVEYDERYVEELIHKFIVF